MNTKESNIVEKYRADYKPYPYLLKTTDLEFYFYEEYCRVISKLRFERNLADNAPEENILILEGQNMELMSLSLDGVMLSHSSYQVTDEQLIIEDLPNSFLLTVETKIQPEKNTTLNGLYKSNKKYCTQCEAEGFRNITYYPDRPDVLSVYNTYIETDIESYPYLLSNGELQEQGVLEGERHFARWSDPHPKPSYLFALVAGDFDLLEEQFTTTSGKKIKLEIYADKGKIDQCHYAMESLVKSMQWDQDKYALEYDLDRYMIVAVGDFNMGAMENKGLNIFNTAYVLANDKTASDNDFQRVEAVIGHEYFHNWTGNRVTCRDWFQLSLKEGLTVFREQQFSGDMNSEAIQRIDDVKTLRAFQFPEDAGPMAHPIRPDSYIEMNNFYTHTVYIKGAEVIRMLETILGKEQFNQGVRHYLSKHDGQAVTCEDFVVAMEDVSGLDLTQFRNWYSQSGTPEVNLQGSWNSESKEWTLEIDQSCPATPGQIHKLPFMIPLKMSLIDAAGKALELKPETTDQLLNYSYGEDKTEIILQLCKAQHRVTFKDIECDAVPSLLREFSAPVKLNYPYSTEQRQHLISRDSDAYVRWQANQELTQSVIEALLREQGEQDMDEIVAPLVACRKFLLTDQQAEVSFKALQLELPSLAYVMELFNPIPVDALISIWPKLCKSVSAQLHSELIATVNDCRAQLSSTSISREQGAPWRKLLNASVSILAYGESEQARQLIADLYDSYDWMTIRQHVLQTTCHYYPNNSTSMLADFYDSWQEEDLVIDKWFALQASQPNDAVFETINDLLQHADFQITNPNRVRSVLATFTRANPSQFHHKSGRGYTLLADQVIRTNKMNPQLSSRLVSAFNGWRQLDCVDRQTTIKHELQRILDTEDLSADVFEIANKALASATAE